MKKTALIFSLILLTSMKLFSMNLTNFSKVINLIDTYTQQIPDVSILEDIVNSFYDLSDQEKKDVFVYARNQNLEIPGFDLNFNDFERNNVSNSEDTDSEKTEKKEIEIALNFKDSDEAAQSYEVILSEKDDVSRETNGFKEELERLNNQKKLFEKENKELEGENKKLLNEINQFQSLNTDLNNDLSNYKNKMREVRANMLIARENKQLQNEIQKLKEKK